MHNKECDSDEIGDVQGELDQLENSVKENEEIQADDILYWTAGRKDNENSKIHVQTNENKKKDEVHQTPDRSSKMNTNLIQTPELGRNDSDDEDKLRFDADDLTKKISAIKPKYNKLINKDSYFIDDEENDDDELLKDLDTFGNNTQHDNKINDNSIDIQCNYNKSNEIVNENCDNPQEDNGTPNQKEKRRRIKSSLSMVDEISLKRMSRDDFDQIQDLIKPEIILVNQTTFDPNPTENDFAFKSGDVSVNKTYVDGSVIIHTGHKPININTSQLGVLDASGYDINAYYGVNEKEMSTQLNISTFDNPNVSKLDTSNFK